MRNILLFFSLSIFLGLSEAAQGAPTSFTGRITATSKTGGFSRSLLYTYGTNALRIQVTGNPVPNPIDIIELSGAQTIIAFPANRSFIHLKSSHGLPPRSMPMTGPHARLPQMSSPGRPGVIGPTNLPGTPAPPQMPAMPRMPVAGTMGGMPAMPMPGENATLKATGDKTNRLGYACEKYEVKQRGEVMDIWATRQLPAFHNWQPNQRPRFGPRMLEDQWGDLLRAKHLFPLLAELKLPNGAERFRFEVKKITPQNPKKENPALFQPPANYHEIQPLPF